MRFYVRTGGSSTRPAANITPHAAVADAATSIPAVALVWARQLGQTVSRDRILPGGFALFGWEVIAQYVLMLCSTHMYVCSMCVSVCTYFARVHEAWGGSGVGCAWWVLVH